MTAAERLTADERHEIREYHKPNQATQDRLLDALDAAEERLREACDFITDCCQWEDISGTETSQQKQMLEWLKKHDTRVAKEQE